MLASGLLCIFQLPAGFSHAKCRLGDDWMRPVRSVSGNFVAGNFQYRRQVCRSAHRDVALLALAGSGLLSGPTLVGVSDAFQGDLGLLAPSSSPSCCFVGLGCYGIVSAREAEQTGEGVAEKAQ